MSEFGAEKYRLFSGPSKDNGWLLLKNPELPDDFWGKAFIGSIWGEGCSKRGFLLIGWWCKSLCSRNLLLSPRLPFSTWAGASSCKRAQRYCCVFPLRRNQGPEQGLRYWFSALLACRYNPSIPNQPLFEPTLGSSGRSGRLNEICFLQTCNGRSREHPEAPRWAPLSFCFIVLRREKQGILTYGRKWRFGESGNVNRKGCGVKGRKKQSADNFEDLEAGLEVGWWVTQWARNPVLLTGTGL